MPIPQEQIKNLKALLEFWDFKIEQENTAEARVFINRREFDWLFQGGADVLAGKTPRPLMMDAHEADRAVMRLALFELVEKLRVTRRGRTFLIEIQERFELNSYEFSITEVKSAC